jgi:hypothetical protein
MRTTPFRTHAEAALTGAGFQPVQMDAHPYRNVRGSPTDAGYKRHIEGTGNEILVVVRDNYAFACALNPEGDGVRAIIARSEHVNDVQDVLPVARWAWSVGRENDEGCQLLTHQSRHTKVCGAPFAPKPGGGYICSERCWMPRQRPNRRTTAGYF